MFVLDEAIARRIVPCATELCWRQWRSIAATGLASGQPAETTIIDPEALVLLSLSMRRHERRLDDQLQWWASVGASLMGVQRMRTLLAQFPARMREDLAWFASLAVDAGDARWKVLTLAGSEPRAGRPGKGPRELQLVEPSTLMLRMRAGFGVGAKADLLSYLLGSPGSRSTPGPWATTEQIAQATSYSIAATRRAAVEMALGRFVTTNGDRPVGYSVDPEPWARLLCLQMPGATSQEPHAGIPPWRHWSQMFAFLAACIDLGSSKVAQAPAVVQASHLRDLADRFRQPLSWNGIEWVDPRRTPGERYVEAFRSTLDAVLSLTEVGT